MNHPQRVPIVSDSSHFLKIILLGDSSVGKTSLIHRFVNKSFSDKYKSTIGAEFFTSEYVINGRMFTLQIWDTAGLERFRSLGTAFYRGCDCCLLCYDVTNQRSFDNLNSWRDEFLIQGNPDNPDKFPFAVIGNKIDLEDKRKVSRKIAEQWAKSIPSTAYFETSAKNSDGTEEAFSSVIQRAFERERQTDYSNDEMYRRVKLTQEIKKSSRGCKC